MRHGLRGSSIAQREYFKTVMATNAPVISEPISGKASFEPSIVFASPLRNPDGKVIGMLGGILYLSKPNFLSAMGTARIGTDGYFYLVTKGGNPTFIMHAERDRIMTRAPDASVNPHLAQALQGFEGTVESVNSRGLEALFSYRSLRSVPWVLSAVYPTAEAYAAMRQRDSQILGFGVLLAFVCGAAIWWFAGRLLAPLDQLRNAMQANDGTSDALTEAARVESRELAEVIHAYTTLMENKLASEAALRQSEDRIRGIIMRAPDAFIGIDAHGIITAWNRQAEETFGWDRDEVIGKNLANLLIPEAMRERHNAGMAGFVGTGQGPVVNNRVEVMALHRNGMEIPVELSVVAVRNGDKYVANAFLRNISERKSAEQKLAASEKRLRAITDNLPVLISYLDREQRYRFINATYESWLNIDASRIIGRRIGEIVSENWYEQLRPHMEQALDGNAARFEIETETGGIMRHLQTIYIPHHEEDGSVAGVYTLTTDVSALKAVEKQLTLLARFDSLTGLPNRRHFDEKLNEAIARSDRTGNPMALMYLDIDHFKEINDTLGHAAGDDILKQFGGRLKDSVRVTDTVARLAGDEFVIILEVLRTVEEAELVARKIVLAMCKNFEMENASLQVTTSIGVAFRERKDLPAAELLALADRALYQAKDAGRNTFHVLTS
ncbi:diguanylate cyclase domain-containing protein [Noviherbaspirillum cavernae]|nr:diguanylate cyclase [Noviherbaspirillum cavernae]